jgi:GntR family transcriptional regulator, rspAB operon transcriptional repressor
MKLVKLERQRAVDAVYQVLRNAIVTYAIKPGERLNIEDLAARLGVSLTPIRGAIQQLSTEGLVDIRSRSGTFVASLTAQDVDETFRIRCALECLAAQDGLPNLGAKEIRRLKDLLKSMRKPVRNAEEKVAHEADNSELHQIIVRSSGNRRLIEMYEALNAHIKIARIHGSETTWPARVSDEQKEHEAIVAAIEKGDAEELCSSLRAHIHRAKNVLVAALRELEKSHTANGNPKGRD